MSSIRRIFAGFLANEGFFLAGGLSFYFLVCFLPLLFLIISLTGFVLQPETVTGQLRDFLAQSVPIYQDEITRTLLKIIETRRQFGVVGTTILVLFSTQLFAALRVVLNRIFSLHGHPLLHGMLFDALMILLVGVLFVANVATTAVVAWLKLLATRQVDIPAFLSGRLSIILGFVFATAMFFIPYRFFPNQRISTRAALSGALVASALWELAKHLLRVYVLRFGLYHEIYGPLGVLMAFIMFVYYSAIVFVFSAEVVAALQARRSDASAAPRGAS